jgi:surface carbohydrate biosynthesis protein
MGSAGLKPRICLVVDNPLRDLDGLVLLAWQLARRGADAWLVPMYEQAFDVGAIGADFVLLNYLRPNNLDLAKQCIADGVKVGVLDTEGAGGKNAEEFAELTAKSGGSHWMDLYCVWGEGQHAALRQRGLVRDDALRLTGCPRYDWCAHPWRDALPSPAVEPGYVLVNTNFPVVNPRFSSGSEGERDTMVRAGFSEEFARRYVADARVAHQGMVVLMRGLLERFPQQRFVLRPHPFESDEPYLPLMDSPNFSLRQEGTSVEWLNKAAALLHLNCSTAVEAAMLDVPALSPAWLDTPVLNVPVPHAVSRHCPDKDSLECALGEILSTPGRGTAQAAQFQELLSLTYYRIDGESAVRVADAILQTVGKAAIPARIPHLSLRGRLVRRGRRLLSFRGFQRLSALVSSNEVLQRRRAKRFDAEQVIRLVERLERCAGDVGTVRVDAMRDVELPKPRFASGASIRLSVPANR